LVAVRAAAGIAEVRRTPVATVAARTPPETAQRQDEAQAARLMTALFGMCPEAMLA